MLLRTGIFGGERWGEGEGGIENHGVYMNIYEKENFGKIKLTVGELRGSNKKVQYCITAIENDY